MANLYKLHKDEIKCEFVKLFISLVNEANQSLLPNVFVNLSTVTMDAGACLPDVVFNYKAINKMASLVENISKNNQKELKFHIKNSKASTDEEMLE